jgi:hypothetical protein
MRIVKAVAVSGFGLAALFTGVMGFAHTHAGRPLLVAMRPLMSLMAGGSAKCPFGYDQRATPEQKEAARASFSEAHHGDEVAAGRPALGFALDTTTPADVMAWAKAHDVDCKEKAGGLTQSDIECRSVPDSVLPEAARGALVSSLWLTFGGHNTLTKVVAVRKDKSAEAISRAFGAVSRDVAQEAGPATSTEGNGTVAELTSGRLVQSSAEYRFSNYYVLTRAANVGSAFVMTEEYRSLAD